MNSNRLPNSSKDQLKNEEIELKSAEIECGLARYLSMFATEKCRLEPSANLSGNSVKFLHDKKIILYSDDCKKASKKALMQLERCEKALGSSKPRF